MSRRVASTSVLALDYPSAVEQGAQPLPDVIRLTRATC